MANPTPPVNPGDPLPIQPGESVEAYAGRAGASAPAAASGWNDTYQAVFGINAAEAGIPAKEDAWGQTNARVAEAGGTDVRAYDSTATTVGALIQSLASMTVSARKELQKRLVASGNLPQTYQVAGALDKQMVAGFADLLKESAANSVVNPNSSWSDYLTEKIRSIEVDAATPKVSKSVRLLSMSEASPVFRDAFSAAVGRAPTDAEISKFVNAYNAKAKSSPVTETSQMTGGVQTTTTMGGVDPGQVAHDMAVENPDYANYQAVATYMPLLEKALGPIGGVSD